MPLVVQIKIDERNSPRSQMKDRTKDRMERSDEHEAVRVVAISRLYVAIFRSRRRQFVVGLTHRR